MSRQPISRVYIYTYTKGCEGLPVGVLSKGADGEFRFGYASSWLQNPNRYAIDPVNLPLQEEPYKSKYLWLNFEDMMPDNWGRRVILSVHKDQPKNKLEWMLSSRGNGVGALAASASLNHPPKLAEPPSMDRLHELLRAAKEIETGSFDSHHFSEEMVKLLAYNSSMGGARPKITVRSDGREWIVKLSRKDDVFNQVKAEAACMNLARKAGLNVPSIKLASISDEEVFMIERFDRDNDSRKHYLSANGVLNLSKIRMNDERPGYPYLCGVLQGLSDRADTDSKELFARMIFNILTGNTDDHLKNHGFLMNDSGQYGVSPLFDVLPHPGQTDEMALLVGKFGRAASIENALSSHALFGISKEEAARIIQRIADTASGYVDDFLLCGMSSTDIAMLGAIVEEKLEEAERSLAAIHSIEPKAPGRDV